ncbi:DUF4339 domain-containing protein [Methylorubrum extorquens]|uniref:DUF4339 domain-containing protein n=1 Tax=Methylorubrum extorquens TaxID=408 RepID=UPI000DF22C9A|nr:DUF4339 domain-containing protein [Methylorubrum extorquens]
MKEWFYINRDNAATGPVTDNDLYSLLREGGVDADTRIWTNEYGKEWKPIHATEFRGGLKPPPIPVEALTARPNYGGAAPTEPVPVTIPAVGKFFKVLFIIICIPVGLFIVFLFSEAASPTEYYASSIGMSISDCRKTMMAFGTTYGEADLKCSERIRKKDR